MELLEQCACLVGAKLCIPQSWRKLKYKKWQLWSRSVIQRLAQYHCSLNSLIKLIACLAIIYLRNQLIARPKIQELLIPGWLSCPVAKAKERNRIKCMFEMFHKESTEWPFSEEWCVLSSCHQPHYTLLKLNFLFWCFPSSIEEEDFQLASHGCLNIFRW